MALEAVGVLDPVSFAVMFVSTITVAGADTIASEIGVRDKNVYMITNFQKVDPGINGGVSKTGTAVSTLAALLIAALSASGTSRIDNIAQIDRGYEDIEARLNALGAKIERVTSFSADK